MMMKFFLQFFLNSDENSNLEDMFLLSEIELQAEETTFRIETRRATPCVFEFGYLDT
jgi:hypothetical protein